MGTMPGESRCDSFDKEIYRHRNKVEHLIGRIKEFRRIANPKENRAQNYSVMLTT